MVGRWAGNKHPSDAGELDWK